MTIALHCHAELAFHRRSIQNRAYAAHVELKLDLRPMGLMLNSTTRTELQQKTRARGIGGGVRTEASIEGIRFRCNVQAASRPHRFLRHRNLRHALRRLKRAFRFRKVLWLLSSKESNNKKNLCSPGFCRRVRHGVTASRHSSLGLADGTGVPRNTCRAGLLSGVVVSAREPLVELKLDLRPMGVVHQSTTRTL